MQSYQLELYFVERRLEEYLILNMDDDDGRETGFDFIPDEDCEEVTCRFIAKEFNISYDHLTTIRYSEYLRWVARYKAVHWTKPERASFSDDHPPDAWDNSDAAREWRVKRYQS